MIKDPIFSSFFLLSQPVRFKKDTKIEKVVSVPCQLFETEYGTERWDLNDGGESFSLLFPPAKVTDRSLFQGCQLVVVQPMFFALFFTFFFSGGRQKTKADKTTRTRIGNLEMTLHLSLCFQHLTFFPRLFSLLSLLDDDNARCLAFLLSSPGICAHRVQK